MGNKKSNNKNSAVETGMAMNRTNKLTKVVVATALALAAMPVAHQTFKLMPTNDTRVVSLDDERVSLVVTSPATNDNVILAESSYSQSESAADMGNMILPANAGVAIVDSNSLTSVNASAERQKSELSKAEKQAIASAKMSGPVAAIVASGTDGLVDIVVRYESQPALFDDANVEALGGEVVRGYDSFAMRALRLPANVITELAIDTNVKWLSVDSVVGTTSLASRQAANVPGSQSTNGYYEGAGVGIAVVDSGVAKHPDLDDSILQYDFSKGQYPRPVISNGQVVNTNSSELRDNFGHGTHVAGILNGFSRHTNEANGLARQSPIISLKVLNDGGNGQISNVIAAADWLLEYGEFFDIRVVNLSLGMSVKESNKTDPLVLAVERLWDAGFVVVAAAGNDGRSGNMTINSPGNSRKIITVGSLTERRTGKTYSDDYVSSFSSMGPTAGDQVLKPDLLAPGNKIIATSRKYGKLTGMVSADRIKSCHSSDCDNAYLELSGTSMATPMVSAAAARMLEKQPGLSPDTIKARLMRTARKVDDEPTAAGAGLLNINAAMNTSGEVSGKALSPLILRDAVTGDVYIEDTAELWGSSRWAAGYLYYGGFNWAEGVGSATSGISANGFLWTDNGVWSRGFLWTDEGGSDSNSVWSRGFLWTDEGTMGGRSLFQENGDGLEINDDP
ncbi:MAG: S8 family peptidase [Woeseiaceae bacterium]